MGIDLYYAALSSPCRAVLLTARNLGIEVNIKNLDLFAGEQMSPDFLKINPVHQVPAIDDNGFTLAESKAIMQYLCNAYAQDDKFYPKLTRKRALVESRLLFEMGTLYKSFADAYYPAIFAGATIDVDKLKKFDENLNHLEGFLKETKYVAGDSLTIADFAIIADLTTFSETGHSLAEFPTILEYMEKCKEEIVGFDENEEGAKIFGEMAKSKINNKE